MFRATRYAREAHAWAVQGMGQDAVDLFVVVPLLVGILPLLRRDSVRAWLVWVGLMFYVAYSYVLYSFFVHFGPLFLVYVGALGMSFYAIVGSFVAVDRRQLETLFNRTRVPYAAAGLLIGQAALFGVLWLSQIADALISGQPPAEVMSLGFMVNPIHVLDLAFALPAIMAAGVLLWRRHALGFLFGPPLLTFSALMSLAIGGMSVATMWDNGESLTAIAGALVPWAVMSTANLGAAIDLLRRVPARNNSRERGESWSRVMVSVGHTSTHARP
jgi:hypothetical protein